MDTLLRLSRLDTAQLRELIQRLPNPDASAREMVRRGWITQDQFSSLSLTPRETVSGAAEEDNLADPDCDWSLVLSDEEWNQLLREEEAKAVVPPAVEHAQPEPTKVETAPTPPGSASVPPLVSDKPAPSLDTMTEPRRRDSDRDDRARPWLGWAAKGLLMGVLFLWSLFAGLQFFWANSTVLAVARQESKEAKVQPAAPTPPPPETPMTVPPPEPAVPPALPVAVKTPTQANNARPKSTVSIYDHVRQVVRANKTVETERLGIGDIAYQDVPADGSIVVGMEVTYAPFFNHNIIKSVRAIYQGRDGTRYDGPVCGTPTALSERVVAKAGYALGGATIRSGMGIDGMQLKFMQIGADGLNPDKSYLSKWLGGYGANARTYVNDGRPIIGIAGMRAKDTRGPAFCLCLVTIPQEPAPLQTAVPPIVSQQGGRPSVNAPSNR
jgi:hypothetical protein